MATCNATQESLTNAGVPINGHCPCGQPWVNHRSYAQLQAQTAVALAYPHPAVPVPEPGTQIHPQTTVQSSALPQHRGQADATIALLMELRGMVVSVAHQQTALVEEQTALRHQQTALVQQQTVIVAEIKRHFDFMSNANGICDISDQQSDVSAPTKSEVKLAFNRRCIVTGEVCNAGDEARFKVAHIVPRKARHQIQIMNHFGITNDDLNHASNLIFLACEQEKTFDKCEWTFIPTGEGKTFGARDRAGRHLSKSAIEMPQVVSRKMLMIHCMDFHRKHKLPFNEQPWLDLTPRKTTNQIAESVLRWMKEVVPRD